jgi:hypothetical protein
MLMFFIAGFLGGAIRGIIGITKYTLSYKDIKINWLYFGGLTAISGLIGLIASWIILELGLSFEGIKGPSSAIALIVGYAGGDFLENIFKVLMKKPILFGQKEE